MVITFYYIVGTHFLDRSIRTIHEVGCAHISWGYSYTLRMTNSLSCKRGTPYKFVKSGKRYVLPVSTIPPVPTSIRLSLTVLDEETRINIGCSLVASTIEKSWTKILREDIVDVLGQPEIY